MLITSRTAGEEDIIALNKDVILKSLWPEYVGLFKWVETSCLPVDRMRHFFDLHNRLLEFRLIEKKMNDIIRWSSYVDKMTPNNGLIRIRPHSVYQHTCSSVVAVICLLEKNSESEVLGVSSGFMQDAFYIHAFGEGLTGRDVIAAKKNIGHDLEEYESVVKYLKSFKDQKLFSRFYPAFMIQYVLSYHNDPELFVNFPDQARADLEYLWESKQQSAIWFKVLELFGYFIYALEQLHDYDNYKIISDVVLRNYHELRKAMEQTDDLKDILWTKDISELLKELNSRLVVAQ